MRDRRKSREKGGAFSKSYSEVMKVRADEKAQRNRHREERGEPKEAVWRTTIPDRRNCGEDVGDMKCGGRGFVRNPKREQRN